jgi:hypothetical protein
LEPRACSLLRLDPEKGKVPLASGR